MRLTGIFVYWSVLLLLSTATAVAKIIAPGVLETVIPVPTPTLATYVVGLDWHSMLVAALIALTGGAGRTATSLFKDGQTVQSAVRETVKDALVALFTGALCFLLLQAYGTVFTPPPLALQATFIFIAGFARGKFIDWLDAAFGKALDLGYDLAASWARSKVPPPPTAKE